MVIPAMLRKKMGLKTGDRVLATFDEETEILKIQRAETFDEALEKIASWKKPGIEPLVDTRTLFNQRESRL